MAGPALKNGTHIPASSTTSPKIPKTSTEKRQTFYRKLEADNLSCSGMCSAASSRRSQRAHAGPSRGISNSIRTYMVEAGTLVTANEAERRVSFWKIRGCAGRRRSRPRSMPASSSLCRARSLPRTADDGRRCASCWRAAPYAAGRRFACPPLAGSAMAIHVRHLPQILEI
jgi:hypothetical protein